MTSGYNLFMAMFVVTLGFMGMLAFYYGVATENNVNLDPQYHNTFSLINQTIPSSKTLERNLEEKIAGGSDIQENIIAPKSSFESGVTFVLNFPLIFKDMIQGIAVAIGIPFEWFISSIILILIITVSFIGLKFLRGGEL